MMNLFLFFVEFYNDDDAAYIIDDDVTTIAGCQVN